VLEESFSNTYNYLGLTRMTNEDAQVPGVMGDTPKNIDTLNLSQISDDVLMHLLGYLTAQERIPLRLANKSLRIGDLTKGK
jgi:hypothetical protein